jgi:hypothetical protein
MLFVLLPTLHFDHDVGGTRKLSLAPAAKVRRFPFDDSCSLHSLLLDQSALTCADTAVQITPQYVAISNRWRDEFDDCAVSVVLPVFKKYYQDLAMRPIKSLLRHRSSPLKLHLIVDAEGVEIFKEIALSQVFAAVKWILYDVASPTGYHFPRLESSFKLCGHSKLCPWVMLYSLFDRIIEDTTDLVITGAADIFFLRDPAEAYKDFVSRDNGDAMFMSSKRNWGRVKRRVPALDANLEPIFNVTRVQTIFEHGNPWPLGPNGLMMTPAMMHVQRMRAQNFSSTMEGLFPWLGANYPNLTYSRGGPHLQDMMIFSLIATRQPRSVIYTDCRFGMTGATQCDQHPILSFHLFSSYKHQKPCTRTRRRECVKRRHRLFNVISTYSGYDDLAWTNFNYTHKCAHSV